MVGLVLVSHSGTLVDGLREMVAQVAGDDVPVATAGGTEDGRLGTEEGLYLLLDGADHLSRAAGRLDRMVKAAPDAAQSSAAKLALGRVALEPTMSRGRAREEPRLEQAQMYLETITESKDLPELAVVETQAKLADALDEAGKTDDAARVRAKTIDAYNDSETARDSLEDLKRRRGGNN